MTPQSRHHTGADADSTTTCSAFLAEGHFTAMNVEAIEISEEITAGAVGRRAGRIGARILEHQPRASYEDVFAWSLHIIGAPAPLRSRSQFPGVPPTPTSDPKSRIYTSEYADPDPAVPALGSRSTQHHESDL